MKNSKNYPTIDIVETGNMIKKLMKSKGLSVCDIQEYLGLSTPQSVYHWFNGRNMPTIDNLYALSELFRVPIDAMVCGARNVRFAFSQTIPTHRLYVYYERIQKLNVV